MKNWTKLGWVRFYRKNIDSSVWDNPITWKVWSWCLLKASHKTHNFIFNNSEITLHPGQFLTGRKVASKELGLSERQFRTNLGYLVGTKRVSSKTTNRFTLITVNKWAEYQTDDQRIDQQATNKRPHTRMNKNEKKLINYFVFKDGTRAFKDKKDGVWKECDSFLKLEYVYLKELK